MAIATEVISALQGRGVTLEADGAGGLRVTGISRLSDHEKATLRAHKASILKVLSQTHPPPPAPVAGSTVATEPLPKECRNCCHWQQYPYEAPLGNCHALRRMQHATSKPKTFGCSDFKLSSGRQEVRL